MTLSPPESTACRESLVQFSVAGLPLYGIAHQPIIGEGAAGVVLLGGWSGTRVGPHGILTAAARELAAAGLAALRFDYRGRGDSGGDQAQAHIGSMVEDAQAAALFLQQETGAKRIFVLGICAGAQVAMAAAPGIERLAGMALWSPPPFHPDVSPKAGAANDNPHRTAKARPQRIALLKQYGRKLLDPRTWAKLSGGTLQPRLILRILLGRPAGAPIRAAGPAGGWAGPKPDERIYEAAMPGITAPALYLYGSNDPEQEDAAAYYARLRNPGAVTRFAVIDGANHSFYSLEWKQEVIRRTVAWIKSVCAESCT